MIMLDKNVIFIDFYLCPARKVFWVCAVYWPTCGPDLSPFVIPGDQKKVGKKIRVTFNVLISKLIQMCCLKTRTCDPV